MSVGCNCGNCTCKDTRSVNTNEQIIAGVIVEVDHDITLPERYKTIFHGRQIYREENIPGGIQLKILLMQGLPMN